MLQHCSRRQFVRSLVLFVSGTATAGCGTVLYPERRGQPAGPLDWGVVALDSLGLLLFFVPGVIAFAVDFNNGSIYLPPDRYGEVDSPVPAKLRRIDVPRQQLTREGISNVVSQAMGHKITLAPHTFETRPLAQLDEFWGARDAMVAAASNSTPSPPVLRSQSPPK